MFDYTMYEFKCPYCGFEYATTVGHGMDYKYKDKIYSAVVYPCPNCAKDFLYGHEEDGEDKFIKMPEDGNELEFYSCWMS